MNTSLETLLQQTDTLKARLQQARPLNNEALSKIKTALEMEYTFESNRIEGNTLTLQETALVVSEGVTIGGKSMREHLEAINHAQAVEFIKDIATADIEITERTIKEIHGIILHSINKEQAASTILQEALPDDNRVAFLKQLDYTGSIDNIVAKIKRDTVLLSGAINELDAAKSGSSEDGMTESDFTRWIVSVSKFMGYRIDRQQVTVAEFLEMIREFEENIKMREKQAI